MSDKIKMTIEVQVTKPQALALQAMFEYMTYLGAIGSSREVAFFADGDGGFRPNCEFVFSEDIPPLSDKLKKLAIAKNKGGNMLFDFDEIAWSLHKTSDRGVKMENTRGGIER